MCQLLAQTGSDAADEIIEKELLWSPHILHDHTEHPQHEHIHQDMCEVAVHEHIGNELPDTEVRSQKEMQTEKSIQVDVHPPQGIRGNEHQHIDDKKILRYYRYISHLPYSYSITTYCFNTAKLRNSPVIKQKTSDIKDFFCDFLHFSLDFICFLKVNNYICSIILNIIHR